MSALSPGAISSPASSRPLPEVQEGPVHPLEAHFEDIREVRRKRYAGARPSPKRRAVQTIVHNEAVFLPIWLRHYSRFFSPEDIYVLDNETSDGSTEAGGFARIPVAHHSVDHAWMAATLATHQRELLDRYDVVLTTDVDEIVAPLPEWGPLDAYLDRLDEEFVNALGYEILHMKDREDRFRPELAVLDQRRYWFANDGYGKPVLATEPMTWTPGLHHRSDGRLNFDPDLRLIHLHRMDYDVCLERHRMRRRRAWNESDLSAGWATHNRVVDPDEFERWFYEDSAFEDAGIRIAVERIPPSWRGLF